MRDPLGEDHLGDGIPAPEKELVLEVQELAGEVVEPAPTPPEFVLIGAGSPEGIVVGQDHQRNHGPTPELDQPAVVPIHPECHLGIAMGLGLGVEQDVLREAIGTGDSDETVQVLASEFGIVGDLPEFRVEIDRRFGPIDAPMDRPLAEPEERTEEEVPGLLPGAVEIGNWIGHVTDSTLSGSSSNIARFGDRTGLASGVIWMPDSPLGAETVAWRDGSGFQPCRNLGDCPFDPLDPRVGRGAILRVAPLLVPP